LQVAESTAKSIVGHDAEADLVRDQYERRRGLLQRGLKALNLRVDIRTRKQCICEPQRQAIDEQGCGSMGGKRPDDIARRFERPPACSASRLMGGDAFRHLGVAGFGRCHINPWRRQCRNQALGIAALARASTAENEREPGAAGCSGCRQDFLRAGNELAD
jgi:hypothetical protein